MTLANSGHPRRSAVASLKLCPRDPRRQHPHRRHPRRSAVASLKRSGGPRNRGVPVAGHPRRSAVASLKRFQCDGHCGYSFASSTAISRGLIEAPGTSLPVHRRLRHPRRSAVASLKHDSRRRSGRGDGQSSTAISRGLIEAGWIAQACAQCTASSTAISRGLIEARHTPPPMAPRPAVIHGDQPWPH